jgi:photosystem I P700 chlorophyll a apoprotein A1
MLALGRADDTFSDFSIQLKPLFASFSGLLVYPLAESQLTNDLLDRAGTSVKVSLEGGTNDFLVHHVHAFTIHVTLLIAMKGLLYSRTSRLVPDKSGMGFRYPCDGPGRGGTCQISGWDSLFLCSFWAYNAIAVIVFHTFWKLQSDVWISGAGSDSLTIKHVTSIYSKVT